MLYLAYPNVYKYGKYCLSFYYSIGGYRGGEGLANKICSAKPVKINEKLFIDGFLKLKLF